MALMRLPENSRVILTTGLLWIASMLFSACSNGESNSRRLDQAKAQIASGELSLANFTLKTVLQEDATQAEARFLLAGILLDAGDLMGAEVESRRAVELGYVRDQAVPQLASAMLALARYQKIIDEFSAVELAQPKAWAALKTTVATAFAMLGNTGKTAELVDEILNKVPNFTPALLVQARLAAGRADIAGATAITDRIIATEPTNVQAWKLRGDLKLSGRKDVTGAIDAYKKLVELAPKGIDGHIALISAKLLNSDIEGATKDTAALRKIYPGSPQAQNLEAQIAFIRGDFVKAREQVQQLLKFSPNNARLLNLAGAVELRLKSWLRAEALLGKAMHLAPDLIPARKMMAQVYLQTGRSGKALEILRPIIESANADAEALAAAAEANLLEGRPQQAEQLYLRAIKLQPKDSSVRTALALLKLSTGDSEQAFSELNALSAGSENGVADLALISAHLQRKEFDAALRSIDKFDAKFPNSARGPLLRAQAHALRRDSAAARKSLELAQQREPGYFAAVAGLAGLDVAEKNPQVAKGRIEAFVGRDPTNEQAWVLLASLVAKSGGSASDVAKVLERAIAAAPSGPDPRVALAEYQLGRHEVRTALATAQAAVALFPERPEVLDVLGRIQQAAGDSNQAIKTFGNMAALQPKSTLGYMRQADVHRAGGNLDAAVASTKRALEVAPDSGPGLAALIALYMQAKQPDKAMQTARSVKKRRPNESIGYVFEGDIEGWQKNWEAAISAYRVGTTKSGGELAARRLHATLLQRTRTADANQFSADWLKKNPRDASFLMHLGDVALAAHNYELAERRYLQVLAVVPGSPAALNNAAWAMVKQKKTGAVALAEKAVANAPERSEFVDTLATALADADQIDRAITLAKQLVMYLPANDNYRLNLVRLYQRKGDNQLAIDQLEPLVTRGTGYAKHAEVAQLMRELGR